MFINKKFFIALVLLTLGMGVYFFSQNPLPPSDSVIKELSDNINSNLPLKIDSNNSLIKTIPQNKDGIKMLDFIILVHSNLNEINMSDYINKKDILIKTSCENEPTKQLLHKSTSIRYRYITLDNQALPIIPVLPRDCKPHV